MFVEVQIKTDRQTEIDRGKEGEAVWGEEEAQIVFPNDKIK